MSSRNPKTGTVTVLLPNLHASETELNPATTNHPTETQILAARCKDEPYFRLQIPRPKPKNTSVVSAKNLHCNLRHIGAKPPLQRRSQGTLSGILYPALQRVCLHFYVRQVTLTAE